MSSVAPAGVSGEVSSRRPAVAQRELEPLRRHEQLLARIAELQWDLGGLTYEMAIRDHFRLDVLVRRAAMLQECEIELAEIDRALHLDP
jgi:hypothetical protein